MLTLGTACIFHHKSLFLYKQVLEENVFDLPVSKTTDKPNSTINLSIDFFLVY